MRKKSFLCNSSNDLNVSLKIAIIGCGRIFDLNVQGYLNNPDCRIVGISDLNQELVESRIATWAKVDPAIKSAKYYQNFVEMIEKERPDIVDILTPHHLHHFMVLKCAELKVPAISLQKPMAISIKECREMIEACKQSGTLFKVYENFVYYPPYQEAKKLLKQGIIGEPNSIRVLTLGAQKGGWHVPLKTWLWRIKADTCGGGPQIFDDGFHKFSAAYYFMDRKVESVFAWIDDYGFIDAPAQILFKYKGDKAVNVSRQKMGIVEFQAMTCGMIKSPYYSCDEFIEIVGDDGLMIINQCTAGGLGADNPMGACSDYPAIRVIKGSKVEDFGADLNRDWSASFINSTADFVQKVKSKSTDFLYYGEMGLELTKFAKAPYYSHILKRDIFLDELTEEFEADPKNQIGKVFRFKYLVRLGVQSLTRGTKKASRYFF